MRQALGHWTAILTCRDACEPGLTTGYRRMCLELCQRACTAHTYARTHKQKEGKMIQPFLFHRGQMSIIFTTVLLMENSIENEVYSRTSFF